MAILCMDKQAHVRHAEEEKLAVSAIQTMLFLLILRLVILDDYFNSKNATTRPWQKVFRVQICNKCAIVREGTGYPSNCGARGMIVMG